MRHLNSQAHFRHALFALQDCDGYVEALLELAREQASARRAPVAFRPAPVQPERRNTAPATAAR